MAAATFLMSSYQVHGDPTPADFMGGQTVQFGLGVDRHRYQQALGAKVETNHANAASLATPHARTILTSNNRQGHHRFLYDLHRTLTALCQGQSA
jgi:hypothetical protein